MDLFQGCPHENIICDHGTDICTDCGLVIGNLSPIDDRPLYSPSESLVSFAARSTTTATISKTVRQRGYVAKCKAKALLVAFYFPKSLVISLPPTGFLSPPHNGNDELLLKTTYDLLKFYDIAGTRVHGRSCISPIGVLKDLLGDKDPHFTEFLKHLHRNMVHAEEFAMALWNHREVILESVYGQGTRQRYSDWDYLFWVFFEIKMKNGNGRRQIKDSHGRQIKDSHGRQIKDSHGRQINYLFWRNIPNYKKQIISQLVHTAMSYLM